MEKIPPPHKAKNKTSFKVENIEKIYEEAAKAQKQIILTNELLQQPLQRVQVCLQTGKSFFDLTAQLEYSDVIGDKPKTPEKVSKRLIAAAEKQGEVYERGGHYVFTAQNGTEVVYFDNYDTLWFTTGDVLYDIDDEVEDGRGKPERLLPAPELTEENLYAAISDFTGSLESAISSAYLISNVNARELELPIAIPDRSVQRSLGMSALQTLAGDFFDDSEEDITEGLEVNVSDFGFEQVGGQDDAIRELRGLAIALAHPEMYRAKGIAPAKGVLIHGLPGTGKTLLAKALAAETDARFLYVKTSDILTEWFGESERNIQIIFDKAVQGDRKTVIYFDEMDSLVPDRSSSDEASQRVVSIILQNLDGLTSSSDIVVIGSTNRKEGMDPAVLRAGRLDRIIEAKMPTEKGRLDILKIHTDKITARAESEVFEELDLSCIAQKTKDYTGADIHEILRRSIENKIRRQFAGEDHELVSMKDIIKEIEDYEHVKKHHDADDIL